MKVSFNNNDSTSKLTFCQATANRCQWNPIASIPEVAIKIEKHKLNILDTNKKEFVFKKFLLLEQSTFCTLQFILRKNLIPVINRSLLD